MKKVGYLRNFTISAALFLSLTGVCFSDEYVEFDKKDTQFTSNLSLLIKSFIKEDELWDNGGKELQNPLIVTKKQETSKFQYYFFIKDIGNTCAAVVFFPAGSDKCWLKVSDSYTSKELATLDHISLRNASDAKKSPLYIWQ